MVCRGISGNCYTVHVMMRACLKDGKPEEAEKYFRGAKAKGIELDVEVCSIVIQAVCKRPNLSLAFVLLKGMREMGWVPLEGTYTCVIGACVKHGNMVEALRLKDEMVSCGKSMNLVVATNLMKGYCVQGNLDSALDLFNRIGEDVLSPNKVTYSVLIEWCGKNGTMERAYELYTQMKEKGIQPSVFNVNSLILGFLKSRSLEMHSSYLRRQLNVELRMFLHIIIFCHDSLKKVR
nr:pentatricopeptide repeat-containing protein At3g54980, mitochondrial-like [Quercus suber]